MCGVQAVRDEAYTHMDGRKQFVHFAQPSDLFPYLLVNIGSGVSMIKVRARSCPSLRRGAIKSRGRPILPRNAFRVSSIRLVLVIKSMSSHLSRASW